MAMNASRPFRVIVALVLAGATLGAQAPSQTPAPPGEPGQPTFRMQIDLITTDVIVRDRNGQFVADLTKEDFQVFEDGVEQEIASLELVHGGRTFNLQAPPPPPPQ